MGLLTILSLSSSNTAGAGTTNVHYPTPQAEENAYRAKSPVVSTPLVAAPDLLQTLRHFDTAIATTNKCTLKPRQTHKPQGVHWWNEECTASHTAARNAPTGEPRKQAIRTHCRTLVKAKHDWAHEQLHHTTESKDIWALAKT